METSSLILPPWERFRLYKDPTFRFEPESHLTFVQGKILWSITGALKHGGIIKTDYYTQEGRIRGQHVHSACHYYDEGDLDWNHLEQNNPGIAGYVRAWAAFCTGFQFVPEMIELPMYASPEQGSLWFSGIPDRVGRIFGKYPAIVEIKTGTMLRWTAYQTAGQDMLLSAWEEKPTFRRRFGVELHADGTYKKPVEFDDQHDYDVMRAALVCSQAAGGIDRGAPPLDLA